MLVLGDELLLFYYYPGELILLLIPITPLVISVLVIPFPSYYAVLLVDIIEVFDIIDDERFKRDSF